MTFAEILTDIYDAVGEPSSPATAVVSRFKRFVNEGHRVILSEPGLRGLVDYVPGTTSNHTVASVASAARIVVRDVVSRVLNISDRTNDITLRHMSLAEYRAREADPSANTGIPTHYVPIGRVALASLPADASELFLKSTDAGDTQVANAEVILSGGATRTLQKTLTGVTALSLNASVVNVIDVADFYLASAAVGTVSLLEDSGSGTAISAINIGQLRPRYTGYLLWPTPSGAFTYHMDYRREVTDLVETTDEPALPLDFHYLLSVYARMRHYEKTDDDRLAMTREIWKLGLSRLKFFLSDANELPVARANRRMGHSRLGGFYPADTWTIY